MINSVDEFIIYDDMQFTKRDWRNRNTIKTPNGLQWLTIPVKVKGKFFQKINETEIDGSSWAEKHWRTIQMNYSKAPAFKMYESKIQQLYEQAAQKKLLSDVNFMFISEACSMLGINTKIRWSSEFNLLDGKTERLLDLCKQVGATRYISGPSARDYIVESLFFKESIDLRWMNYRDYPEYPQKFGGFQHSVSILDLIFNLGTEAKTALKSFNGGVVYE